MTCNGSQTQKSERLPRAPRRILRGRERKRAHTYLIVVYAIVERDYPDDPAGWARTMIMMNTHHAKRIASCNCRPHRVGAQLAVAHPFMCIIGRSGPADSAAIACVSSEIDADSWIRWRSDDDDGKQEKQRQNNQRSPTFRRKG